MFSSNRPKFSFNLTINELSNIPQIGGHCYIEMQIGDGKRFIALSNIVPRRQPRKEEVSKKDSETSESSLNSSSSGNVSTVTSSKRIHNFKCQFNFNVSCNLKFPIKRRENLIGNKYLLLKVYYVNDKNSHDSIELGKLDINLSEYLNFTDPLTSKYLLKQSKVNSILSLTISLSELPSNYDFHTHLQITDAPQASSTTSIGSKKASNGFNVPQFERKNVFSGINNVLPESNPAVPAPSAQSEDEKQKKPSKLSKKIFRHGQHGHTHSSHNSTRMESQSIPSGNKSVIMDPIVSRLYYKILESTWDPELKPLLEYSPEQCIKDIFENPENPQGWNQELAEKFGDWSKDRDEQDENVRDINGLINELTFRDDLRSWTVSQKEEST